MVRKEIQAEDFSKEVLNGEVFGITLVKFLINYDKIMNFTNRVKSGEIQNIDSNIDPEECPYCKKRTDGKLCRRHTSIKRIFDSEVVYKDVSSDLYFVNNEIFQYFEDSKVLMVVYCPHPVLIKDKELTVQNTKAVQLILIKCDFDLKSKDVKSFNLEDALMSNTVKCWFNKIWSIVVCPNDQEDVKTMKFCFLLNDRGNKNRNDE